MTTSIQPKHIRLLDALIFVHSALYPLRHAKLVESIRDRQWEKEPRKLEPDQEWRLIACEFWLRRQVMAGELPVASMDETGQAVPVNAEAFRERDEELAGHAERHGLLALADYYRGHGFCSEQMVLELNLESDALGVPRTALAAKRNVAFDFAVLCNLVRPHAEFLKAVVEGSEELPERIAKELDRWCERRWSIRDVETPRGRPPRTLKGLQAIVIGILVDARDPDLPVPQLRARLGATPGVTFEGNRVVLRRGKTEQSVLWNTLRDQTRKTLRTVARERLEVRSL